MFQIVRECHFYKTLNAFAGIPYVFSSCSPLNTAQYSKSQASVEVVLRGDYCAPACKTMDTAVCKPVKAFLNGIRLFRQQPTHPFIIRA